MPDYGLTSTGFTAKTLEILREEMDEDARAAFGNSIDVTDRSVLGQIFGIVSERYATLWELAEAVFNGRNPDTSTGPALDILGLITGTEREAASPSTVTLTLTGTALTAVAAGSQASVEENGAIFATEEASTLVALTAWANTTAYVADDRRSNSGRSYICTTAGTSAGSGGPTTTASAITDGSVVWRYMGEGAAAVDVEATCTEDGPTVAESGDIDTIETPVSGWQSVLNLLDADLGRDEETDEVLRARREDELAGAGNSPADAIRADVLDVDDVTNAIVFYNDTDATDADGVPPHAVEVLVQGGEDQDIWNQLFASVAAGIKTHGTESGTVTDSEGTEHTVKFSRPTEVLIYADYTLIIDPDEYPDDGDDQVKAALVTHGDAQPVGRDVVASRVASVAFNVAGVLDVTDVDIGTSAAPTLETTITITKRQLAVFDTSRVTVSTSEGSP